MKTERLNYYLPRELIAQRPVDVRSESRLLVLYRCGGELADSRFERVGEFLSAGDCLVLNDTKVLPARFFGRRGSGGKLEGLFLRQAAAGVWAVMLKGAGKVKMGETIHLTDRERGDFCTAEVLEKLEDGECRLRVETEAGCESVLDRIGFPPLPPYIKRGDDANQAAIDRLWYQTVYARKAGAIAAPTAGLHFTKQLIQRLKKGGIDFAFVTLHVGPGTFKPVTAESLDEHKMEPERFNISIENAGIINTAREKGGRIIAVGTTSVRVLETAAEGSRVKAAGGETTLFIKPGYEFKLVDAMVTNFHLPKSTLLALAAAFAGLENILGAYRHAIEQRYRFYSYGDAMLIL
ncbi:MAG TPA: tRNA preQ1(34) S-adenosylmethionine ribosyltransferase-isomerase QueA [Sedimentisphaerales bacterium]|nr:tRNA preQ1(34) S-adenosylmethionine ribosyltransferase-isomerase QueA [Sedimentisphaerales bacterium]